jgi:threonine dehydrogenase-like Zn-dependent dehydrogenase
MRAAVMYGAGDVRIENVPDSRLIEPTDALVRVSRACICGSDLWPYNQMEPDEAGRHMGHEFLGIVENVGAHVRTVKVGDVVVAPFAWSDGTCVFCQEGLHTPDDLARSTTDTPPASSAASRVRRRAPRRSPRAR